MERLAYGLDEVAEMLGLPIEIIRYWCRCGDMPSVRLNEVRLVPREALLQWIEDNTFKPT